jgi:hypothetical protein
VSYSKLSPRKSLPWNKIEERTINYVILHHTTFLLIVNVKNSFFSSLGALTLEVEAYMLAFVLILVYSSS